MELHKKNKKEENIQKNVYLSKKKIQKKNDL
jgi:hypothetical protein